MGNWLDGVDKNSIKIFKKYYTSYKTVEKPTKEELEKGIQAGVLVESENLTHDEMIKTVKELADKIPMEDAAKGFLYSLSTGDLRYRTALASLVWAKALPMHALESKILYRKEECQICGCIHGLHQAEEVDFNQYGVFHYLLPGNNRGKADLGRAEYVYNDLKFFVTLPKVEPTNADYDILNSIMGVVSSMKSHNKATALISAIHKQKIMEGSANGVHQVLGILSMCNILQTETKKGYLHEFTNSGERELTKDNALYYPLAYWNGKCGIDRTAMAEVFGSFAKEKLSEEKKIASDLSAAIIAAEPRKKKSKAQQYFKEDEYLVDLTNEQRYYYGLSAISEKWDKEISYAAVYHAYKRVTLFFEGDVIKKFIFEEVNDSSGDQHYAMYEECDLDAHTKGRKVLLPKTARGNEKPLSPSNLMNPTYMCSHLTVTFAGGTTRVCAFNSSNDQELPLPPVVPRNKKEFEEYTEKYIASCPKDYDQTLEEYLHKKREVVDIKPGDIFRVRVTPTLYTYFLLLGRVKDIWKCPGIPDGHPIYHQMTKPIAYRQYAVLTDNANMTPEELETYPLLMAEVTMDNWVYWATYPIVAHKTLSLSDVEFGFLAGWHSGSILRGGVDKLYWGLAECELKCFTELVKEYKAWRERNPEDVSPFNFVTCLDMNTVNAIWDKDLTKLKIPNTEIYEKQQKYFEEGKQLIIKHLKLDPENAFDDFATKYGGVTRKQFADFLNDMAQKKTK